MPKETKDGASPELMAMRKSAAIGVNPYARTPKKEIRIENRPGFLSPMGEDGIDKWNALRKRESLRRREWFEEDRTLG